MCLAAGTDLAGKFEATPTAIWLSHIQVDCRAETAFPEFPNASLIKIFYIYSIHTIYSVIPLQTGIEAQIRNQKSEAGWESFRYPRKLLLIIRAWHERRTIPTAKITKSLSVQSLAINSVVVAVKASCHMDSPIPRLPATKQ